MTEVLLMFVGVLVVALLMFVGSCYGAEIVRKAWRRK